MRGERSGCRAGVIHAGQAFYIPGKRIRYRAPASLAGRPLYIQGERFTHRASVLHSRLVLLIPDGRFLCLAGVYIINPVNDGSDSYHKINITCIVIYIYTTQFLFVCLCVCSLYKSTPLVVDSPKFACTFLDSWKESTSTPEVSTPNRFFRII